MTQPTIATRDGSTTTVTAETLEDVRQRLRGPLLTPDDEGFEEATRIWNGMIERTPALVVQPTGTADVVAAVDYAREHDLLLSVKGGGHNIAGTALADGGVTIDMSRLRGVLVDPEEGTATAQAGCLIGDIDRETQLHGLVTPGGFVSETGLAGLTLGGGFGYLTRRFGWTVDNLLEVEIVTAAGEVRRASRDENEDLFWAIRGAGHNFGAVTSFTYRLHEVGPTVYGGLVAWPFERADEILEAYRELTAEAPRELTVFTILRRAPPAPFVPEEWHGKRICAMSVCYSGDLGDVDEVLAPIRALEDPVVDQLRELPYTRLQSYLDATQPKGNHYYWKTEFAAELSDDLLSTARDLTGENPIPGGQMVFAHIGGALNEHDPGDGAVGNRDARFAFGAAGMWQPDDPNGDRYREWVRDAWERFRPFSTGGNYINFQTADESEDRIRATYGDNYDRLVETKKRYDPENVFRVNRNIRPE
ncbi:FAD-binding oxidoreductase [Halorarum halophilum]|uniref:FAD-binding oxidoreductase n=1 Tax=Halorarum halophilum TaxID=2743090 RepID=A0A7D5H0E9_9EURY|nr:FAD-binding oxidoreductase [Halobaculum halophilum]QLG27993.1 FAD-binding oxidoreductase [Halobaculum halophilum]